MQDENANNYWNGAFEVLCGGAASPEKQSFREPIEASDLLNGPLPQLQGTAATRDDLQPEASPHFAALFSMTIFR